MQLHLYPVNEFMDNPFVEEIKKDAIEIVKLKPQGKREMDISSFISGYSNKFQMK